MDDLNDYYYFAAVVSSGGFASASRDLKIPRSKLSRRVSRLEEGLGARLIERSTRHFRVTEIGQAFYERCQTILQEADRAKSIVSEAQSDPQGVVRMGCPLGLVDISVGGILPEFLERYPKIKLQIIGSDRRADLINERIDLEVRATNEPETQTSLTMRKLDRARRILVASPSLVERVGGVSCADDLADLPTLAMTSWVSFHTWELIGPNGARQVIRHQPRLTCRSMTAILDAARAGLGFGLLLESACEADLQAGKLVRVLPEWQSEESQFYIVFTTAKGMPPAVRVLIDFLVEKSRHH
ncbi:LysR substrate-binding domain-containing protein [Rhizobium sp. Pop5]|uniref:LysR substrate-binding domain-containing protein n=1 Tax=Rhizobium sp. Pop5 TaxID=1223565 RepID=UPI000283A998|nr:LysR substrate-binding domain-containing protein [Rhizobium sp. Pop5]EJZ21891.1 LysR family transcriptional regulator [Rhizobium sp. Pop5]UVD58838.1 LysR substrate-binding domain-containing protein [Rhizobium sp. Pop5]